MTVSVPTQLPHHHVSDPAFRKLVEDALGQTGHQLHSFQQNFEKVLPPPTTQVSVPPSPSKTIQSSTCQWSEVNPLFPFPFLFPVFLPLSFLCELGFGVGWESHTHTHTHTYTHALHGQ